MGDWSDWPRECLDLRYEINGRNEWEPPTCPFCQNPIDSTSSVTVIGGDFLHIVHTACLPDEALAKAIEDWTPPND